jgi:hypothetical protein
MIYYYIDLNDNIETIETPENENQRAPWAWHQILSSKVQIGLSPIDASYKELINACLDRGTYSLYFTETFNYKKYLRTLFRSKEEAEKLIKEFYIKEVIE